MGRVFDMVAFLSGMIEKNEYEGLSGLLIEKFYNPQIKDYLKFDIKKEIDFFEILNFAARNRGNFELVSSVFINSIINMIKDISKMYNLPVILGGGVFQNKTLLNLVIDELDEVYFNKKIPINDGGVSIGQVAFGIWNC
jgi:hydrogenase maturation protein HypF